MLTKPVDTPQDVARKLSLGRGAVVAIVIFVALFATHFPLLDLPYFWDEAGYYIPAAHDLYTTGALIPHSTLTDAHPPLVMIYLAAAWKFFFYSPEITRCAMLLIATFTLLAVYALAARVSGRSVATASVICTALFPVFFSQSAMAHLDMTAACFMLWGLYYYLAERRIAAVALFALACLAKETAVLAPLSLFAWEWAVHLLKSRRTRVGAVFANFPQCGSLDSFALLLSLVPLIGWFGFHYARTGHVFGNPEFFRYNLGSTLNPLRFLAALALRAWHLFGYMNMALLTAAAAIAMLLQPRREKDGSERRPIVPAVQGVFYALIVVHILALAVLGGAVLARYLVPVYPLVMIVGVATLRRRLPMWPVAVAIVCAGFVLALVRNPPYRFAPEDNLAWTDYVRLHKSADSFVARRFPEGPVLTAWPASDELTRPALGYVVYAPVPIVRIENFSAEQILGAADERGRYRAALVFSTKYEPRYLLRIPGWERLQERFFGYHRDLPPELIARMLGGRIVFEQHRREQWVAVIAIDTIESAKVEGAPGPGSGR